MAQAASQPKEVIDADLLRCLKELLLHTGDRVFVARDYGLDSHALKLVINDEYLASSLEYILEHTDLVRRDPEVEAYQQGAWHFSLRFANEVVTDMEPPEMVRKQTRLDKMLIGRAQLADQLYCVLAMGLGD